MRIRILRPYSQYRIRRRLTCSSPEKAAEELGAETVLLPLEESGRVGGDPGGCCCDPLSGAPSQSRLRRMDGLGERKTTTGYT